MEILDYKIARKYVKKIDKCSELGITFSLSFYEFKRIMTANKCRYTGITLTWQTSQNQIPTDVTIDRIDNSIGYIAGNVVACCKGYNSFKGALENPNNIIDFKILEKALKVQKKLQGGVL